MEKITLKRTPDIFLGLQKPRGFKLVEKNLAISKSFSTWCAYQIRYLLTCYLHDAIWIQKYHNMSPVLQDYIKW